MKAATTEFTKRWELDSPTPVEWKAHASAFGRQVHKMSSVLGSFNGWNRESHPLRPRGTRESGRVHSRVGRVRWSQFFIVSHNHGHRAEKADPLGLLMEKPPRTASVVWDLEYSWNDALE